MLSEECSQDRATAGASLVAAGIAPLFHTIKTERSSRVSLLGLLVFVFFPASLSHATLCFIGLLLLAVKSPFLRLVVWYLRLAQFRIVDRGSSRQSYTRYNGCTWDYPQRAVEALVEKCPTSSWTRFLLIPVFWVSVGPIRCDVDSVSFPFAVQRSAGQVPRSKSRAVFSSCLLEPKMPPGPGLPSLSNARSPAVDPRYTWALLHQFNVSSRTMQMLGAWRMLTAPS